MSESREPSRPLSDSSDPSFSSDSPGAGQQTKPGGPDLQTDERVQALVRQLSQAEAELASLVGGIDSVIDPATLTPILLRQAQADLAASEERFNRLVAAMSAIVFEVDPQGEVLFVNDAITRVTGYLPHELQGRTWAEVLLPGKLQRQAVRLAKRMRKGNVIGHELVIAARDGSRIVVELNSANRYGADGSLERVVGIATDITDRKRMYEDLREHRRQLQAYSRRLMEAAENERRTIARELHDQAGQLLTSLMLGLGVLLKRYDSSQEAQAHVAYLEQIADDLSQCMHRLAVSLRPASLDRLGLIPALRQFTEMMQVQAQVGIKLITPGLKHGRLNPATEITVYRIVQEALTNVVRHAQATSVGIVVQYRDGSVVVIVEDDGVGFDVEAALSSNRLGLLGMRERAEMLGGVLTIESSPDHGTTVYAEIPSEFEPQN